MQHGRCPNLPDGRSYLTLPYTLMQMNPKMNPLSKKPGSASEHFLEGARLIIYRGVLSMSARVAKMKMILRYRNVLNFWNFNLRPIKIKNGPIHV